MFEFVEGCRAGVGVGEGDKVVDVEIGIRMF